MTANQPRRPAGQPTGGQFAPMSHDEPEVSLVQGNLFENLVNSYSPKPDVIGVELAKPTKRYIGICQHCIYPVVRQDNNSSDDYLIENCPQCGRRVDLKRLYGTYIDVNCNANCQFAVDTTCECGCAGANHSVGLLPPIETGEIPADVLAQFRRKAIKRREAEDKRVMANAMKKFEIRVEGNEDVIQWLVENRRTDSSARYLLQRDISRRWLSNYTIDYVRSRMQEEQLTRRKEGV